MTVGLSAVEVKAPRVSDVPTEVSPDGYKSRIVKRYERTSRKTQKLFRKLYLEGLSTGDFEPVFRELVGEIAALSANAIVRLKSKWESEYRVWRGRRLDERRYAYTGTPTYERTGCTWEPDRTVRRRLSCALW